MNGQTLVKGFVPLPAGSQGVYTAPGLTYYRHGDWLGSSRFSSTPVRGCYYDLAYAPFGEDFAHTMQFPCAKDPVDLDFTGQNQDTASGLYDFLYREYAPAQGRWISPDPAGVAAVDPSNPQSWNRYAYVLNNPLSNIDLDGHECIWDDGSFDSADDPETGNSEGCAKDGGTWVNPDLFENTTLTNGQWTSNYGDWSASPNADLAQNWVVPSATAYGGPNAAEQEVDEALDFFRGAGAKPTLVYGPDDPFTRDFQQSLGMRAILAGVAANCGATSGRVRVGTWEAFVNTMIDGLIGGSDGRGVGWGTPEAQIGAFNSTYSRSGGVVNVTVTNPISLNSAAFHLTAHLGIPNPTSGSYGTVHQVLHITAPDPCD